MSGFNEIQTTNRVNVGYPIDWSETQRDLWEAIASDLSAELVVDQALIDDVLACGLMWHEKSRGEAPTASAFKVQRLFYRDLVNGWLDGYLSGERQDPAEYFDWFIEQMPFFDALTQAWLTLLPKKLREGIRIMFTQWTVNIRQSLRDLGGPISVVLGSVEPEFTVGKVKVVTDRLMLTIGEEIPGSEVVWPGATLIGLTIAEPAAMDIETMEIAAAVHTLATGAPPRRVGVWSMTTGKSIVQDVDQSWIETAIAGVTATIERLVQIKEHKKITATGGPHCLLCPIASECEFSESDNHEPF
jgi:hypothetical protein